MLIKRSATNLEVSNLFYEVEVLFLCLMIQKTIFGPYFIENTVPGIFISFVLFLLIYICKDMVR